MVTAFLSSHAIDKAGLRKFKEKPDGCRRVPRSVAPTYIINSTILLAFFIIFLKYISRIANWPRVYLKATVFLVILDFPDIHFVTSSIRSMKIIKHFLSVFPSTCDFFCGQKRHCVVAAQKLFQTTTSVMLPLTKLLPS